MLVDIWHMLLQNVGVKSSRRYLGIQGLCLLADCVINTLRRNCLFHAEHVCSIVLLWKGYGCCTPKPFIGGPVHPNNEWLASMDGASCADSFAVTLEAGHHVLAVQVVLCGDFHQLPPIPERLTLDQRREAVQTRHSRWPEQFLPFLNRGLVFESRTWLEAGFHVHQLSQVHRQDSASFIRILHAIRCGSQTAAHIQQLEDTCLRQDLVLESDLWQPPNKSR